MQITELNRTGSITPLDATDATPVSMPLETALRTAATDLERALELVVAPRRPSFMGHTPLETAAGVLGGATAHLSEALGIVAGHADSPERAALTRHLSHAIGATVDSADLIHELISAGATAPPASALQATAAQLEDALAHARMALAVFAGEP